MHAFDRQTDGRTDGQKSRKTALHSMQRGNNETNHLQAPVCRRDCMTRPGIVVTHTLAGFSCTHVRYYDDILKLRALRCICAMLWCKLQWQALSEYSIMNQRTRPLLRYNCSKRGCHRKVKQIPSLCRP